MKYTADRKMPKTINVMWCDIQHANYKAQLKAMYGDITDYGRECAYKEASDETDEIILNKADLLFQRLQLRKRGIKTQGDLNNYIETWWK